MIKNSTVEREVEAVYNQGLTMYFPEIELKDIKHTFACDGLIETIVNKRRLKLLIEYKFDETLKNRITASKILTQILFYMKKFEMNGMILPNVIMVADINECFVMHTNSLVPYLDEDINWDIAPSKAHHNNPELISKLANDSNIVYFVYDVNENFSFKAVADKIKELAIGIKRYIHITEHNISSIYDYFTNNVIKDKKKIKDNNLVAVFIGALSNHEKFYQHPTNTNKMVTPLGDININGNVYRDFFAHFDREYTPQEKKRFTSISDRLIEDNNRRSKGEFYTPTMFVDYAHKMIMQHFGEDWKEKYIVWDNSCGSKNLTRDYFFKNLYCSTIEEGELEISAKYNREAVSFQFDFLNDELDKLPKSLLDALKNDEPIIIFMNPPYARNSGDGMMGTTEKCCYTKVGESMRHDRMDACIANLYAQFLYRCVQIKNQFNCTNFNICLFSPTLYLSGQSWGKFRQMFFEFFEYKCGCTFKASHFSDVANNWGIAFSIWQSGKTINTSDFSHEAIDIIDGSIQTLHIKDVYNLDNSVRASDWIREDLPKVTKYDVPNLSSGIVVKEKNGSRKCMWNDKALGYLYSASNNVDKNAQSVSLFSFAFSANVGTHMYPINFTKCLALFTARRVIQCDWTNWADEYIKPNCYHPLYQEFENDSIIFSLFESKSNQSALYDIEHSNKRWNINNEFFWLSKDEMIKLATFHNNDDCYNRAVTSNERYVYKLLQNRILSTEAQKVLDLANELLKDSFKYRQLFNTEHPEYQINNWDCGYYQLKPLWKEYFPEQFNKFREAFNKLKEKLIPIVYEVGFLRF